MKKAIFQKIFFTLFCLPITIMSGKMFHAMWLAEKAENFVEHKCTILKNEFKRHGENTILDLLYEYEINGQKHTNTFYQFGLKDFSNQAIDQTKIFVRAFRVGSQSSCYINPTEPSISIIAHGISYPWYMVWIFLIFLLVGWWGLLISFFYPEMAEKIFIPSDPS